MSEAEWFQDLILFLYTFLPRKVPKALCEVKVELFLFVHLSGDLHPLLNPDCIGLRNPPDAFTHKNLTLLFQSQKGQNDKLG